MARAAIEALGLGKRYRIGARSSYRTLRETISGAFTASARRRARAEATTHWALRGVDFRVEPGERVGIIGRNGAGKSTLLKVLARITDPTEGEARVRGRVGSLLEVGTGFHPELTGRENVFLNGTLLGMRAVEVRRKFDEIVAFAEVERFLDTPVKHYSSGMYVRLAFAVAAHLETEILLVDEVLAVGDASFQRKCLGKMEEAGRQGRTVLLVSHNMGLLSSLASRGVVLEAGRIVFDGGTGDAVRAYLSKVGVGGESRVSLVGHPNRLPGMRTVITGVACHQDDGSPATTFLQSDDVVLELAYDTGAGLPLAGAGFIVYTTSGVRVGGFNTYMAWPPPHRLPDRGIVSFIIPARQFTPGSYHVTVSVGSHPGTLEDKVEYAIGFDVSPADIYATGYLLTSGDGICAIVAQARVLPAPHDAVPGVAP